MTLERGPALLFCPADRPDRFEKAAERADYVILDLEDAVPAERRPAAREALRSTPLDPDRTIVRVNQADSPDHAADLAALTQTAYRTVMLPKAESATQVEALHPYQVIALCETAEGVVSSAAIARAANAIALMWGAEDLMASIGGSTSRLPHGAYRDVAKSARSTVLLSAAAAGIAAIDAVYLAIPDLDGLAQEASDAVQTGFALKACIHPSHVPVIRQAFRPGPDEARWAAEVLVAAQAQEGGVFTINGRMIDEPLIRQARRISSRGGDTSTAGTDPVTDPSRMES